MQPSCSPTHGIRGSVATTSIATRCHANSIKANALGLSWNGITFTEPMIKDSLDEQCHVCVDVVGKFRYPYCVFVPKPKQT